MIPEDDKIHNVKKKEENTCICCHKLSQEEMAP